MILEGNDQTNGHKGHQYPYDEDDIALQMLIVVKQETNLKVSIRFFDKGKKSGQHYYSNSTPHYN